MEESLRTRIGQIARNAIQEIDRIAQMSRPSALLEVIRLQVPLVMNRSQVPLVLVQEAMVSSQLGSQERFFLPYPEFAIRETGTH